VLFVRCREYALSVHVLHVAVQDLKPSNFMVKNETVEFFHLQIIDLGLACHIDDRHNQARTIDRSTSLLEQATAEANAYTQAHMYKTRTTSTAMAMRPPAAVTQVGTRGYRAPHMLRTHRCDYQDDLWVGALIVMEMAVGKCVYSLFVHDLKADVSKHRLSELISHAVLRCEYIPWHLLSVSFPHLSSFLRRVTREQQPFFNTAAEVIAFIEDEANAFVFEPIAADMEVSAPIASVMSDPISANQTG
jgi:serine/threonine protein kinase